MADRFFDTSAAAKHYRVEVGTAKVDAFLAEAGARHFLSDLSVVEMHSVLARLVRTGQITAADFHLTRGRFLADIMTPAVFSVTPPTPVEQVVEQLLTLSVHQLYVVDEHQHLIGVISAHDVLRHLHG